MSVHNVNTVGSVDDNARASARAGTILSIYSKMVGGNDDEPEDRVADLLADLRHYSAEVGVDFEQADRRAANNYAEECPPVMTDLQRDKLQVLCSRWRVPFRESDYVIARSRMSRGFAEGWVGGVDGDGSNGRSTVFVGVSPTGESYS